MLVRAVLYVTPKVGTLAKDQFPHARVRVEVRNEIQSFTLDITLSVVREGADCLIWNRRGEPDVVEFCAATEVAIRGHVMAQQ